MKLKKKSGLMGAIIALSCASLVSVGFASWVISQGDTQYAGGTINVDTVTDKSHVITFTNAGSGESNDGVYNEGTKTLTLAKNILFGGPTAAQISEAGYESEDIWLSNDSVENLSVSFSISITNIFAEGSNDLSIAQPSFVTGSLAISDEAKYTEASSTPKFYVGAKPNVVFSAFTRADTSSRSGAATVSVTFTWGSAFSNTNPWVHYNNLPFSAANALDATTKLDDLHTLLDTLTYTITLSAQEA